MVLPLRRRATDPGKRKVHFPASIDRDLADRARVIAAELRQRPSVFAAEAIERAIVEHEIRKRMDGRAA